MNKLNVTKSKKAYTFIELLLTIGIVAIALGSLGGVLVTIVKVNQKAKVMAELNRNADRVFNTFEEDIRKSRNINCKEHQIPGDSSSPCITIDYFVQDSDNDASNDHVELGYVKSGDKSDCSSDAITSPNGYIYYRNYNVTNPTPLDSEIITNNDKSTGVDVKNVEFSINDTGNSTSVSLNMLLSPTLCNNTVNSDKISKSFSDFVISRID